MQAALFEGVYNSFSTIAPTFPTGNCTFPHYRSVGMCSGCNNISDTINTTCGAPTYAAGAPTYAAGASFVPCNWTLPSGFKLNMSEGVVIRMATVVDTTALAVSEIITFAEFLDYDRNHLVDVTEGTGLSSDVMALQCSLYPCVRTYDMVDVENQNTEVLLETSEMVWQNNVNVSLFVIKKQLVGDYIAPYIGAPMPCLLNGTYYDATSFTERNETNTWPITGLLPNNATAYLPRSCVFMYASTYGFEDYLPTFLEGYAIQAPEVCFADPAWMMQVYNAGNTSLQTINVTWTAVADSMTMRIRRDGDLSNSEPAAGVVMQSDTCVLVQLLWLIFPAALLLLTLIFLLATMALSIKYRNRHIWKGSPLALFFHGIDQELSDRYRLVDQLNEIEDKTKHTVVQIKHTQGGLHFVDAARGRKIEI